MDKALKGFACSVAVTMATIIIAAMALTGCKQGHVVKIDNDRGSVYYKDVVIDGCQYIVHSESICHKGNCTNAIHGATAADEHARVNAEFEWLEGKVQGINYRLTMHQLGRTDTNDPIYMGTLGH